MQAQDPALVTRSPRLKSPSVLQHSQHAPLQDHLTRRGHTTSPPATAGRGSPTGTAFSPGTVIWGGEWAPRARMFTLPPFEVKWLIFVCEARVKKSDAYQVHDVLHSEARQVHVRYYCFYVSSSPSLPSFPPSLPPARSCASRLLIRYPHSASVSDWSKMETDLAGPLAAWNVYTLPPPPPPPSRKPS